MKVIKLADGSSLELNINFLTLKLVMKMDILKENKEEMNFDTIGKLIYAIMYSNGKKITEDEALALVPVGDSDAFFDLFEEFQQEVEEFKKKMDSKNFINQVAK